MPSPSRKQPVRKQIELTPKIATHEMFWFKTKEGLRPAAALRSTHGVDPEPRKTGDKTEIHTHPWKDNPGVKAALPSHQDLYIWAQTARTTSNRSFHIASINLQGKVEGYFHFRFTKHFAQAMNDPKIEEEFIHALVKAEFHPSELEKLLQFLKEKKYAVFHIQPMPEYFFNKKLGIFKKL